MNSEPKMWYPRKLIFLGGNLAVTIPREIVDKLKLRKGMTIDLTLTENDEILLSLFGGNNGQGN